MELPKSDFNETIAIASGTTAERIFNCAQNDFLNIRYLTKVRVTGSIHLRIASARASRVTQPASSSTRNDQLYSSFALFHVYLCCAAVGLQPNDLNSHLVGQDNKKIQLGIHVCAFLSYCTFL